MGTNGENKVTKIENRKQSDFSILRQSLKHWSFTKAIISFNLVDLPIGFCFLQLLFCFLCFPAAFRPSIRLSVRASVHPFFRSLVCCLFFRSLIRCLFVRPSVRSFVRSSVRLLVGWFFLSSLSSFVRSFIFSPTFLNISHHSSILRPVSPLLLAAAIPGKTKQK